MSALRCNCCGRRITGATYDAAHTYRLPVFELARYQGQRCAVRVGTRRAAVCAPCVARIHAAADTRRARDGRRIAGQRPGLAAAA